MAGVKALEYCDLYQLDARTLDRIIKTYPHFEVYLQSVAAERSELAKRLSDNGSVT